MNTSFKSLRLMLLGTLIGFTIAFVARGFWIDEFDWGQWLSSMIGGVLVYLVIIFFSYRKKKDNQK